MEAIGGYFRGLREGRDMTPADVAVQLRDILGRKVDPTTIWRIETDRQNPGGDLLLGLVTVLKGRMADVQALFKRSDASAADGEALGRSIAATGYDDLTDDDLALFGRLTPEKKRLALELIDQLSRVS